VSINVSAISLDRNHRQVTIDKHPDNCPICHAALVPIAISDAFFADAEGGRQVEIAFQCPNQKCQRLFVAGYRQRLSATYDLIYTAPIVPQEMTFAPEIKAISPVFCEIYAQAHKAEQLQLTLICGAGYRKALEFVVKDYVVSSHTADAEKIKAMPLGQCIATYVGSDKVKAVASRAAWLGNDETHYSRKWEDKDLQDLKRLISLERVSKIPPQRDPEAG
jgi:hypothetical protein